MTTPGGKEMEKVEKAAGDWTPDDEPWALIRDLHKRLQRVERDVDELKVAGLRVVVDPTCPPDSIYFLDPEAAEQRGAEIVVATDEIARRLQRDPDEVQRMAGRIDLATTQKGTPEV